MSIVEGGKRKEPCVCIDQECDQKCVDQKRRKLVHEGPPPPLYDQSVPRSDILLLQFGNAINLVFYLPEQKCIDCEGTTTGRRCDKCIKRLQERNERRERRESRKTIRRDVQRDRAVRMDHKDRRVKFDFGANQTVLIDLEGKGNKVNHKTKTTRTYIIY